MKTLAFPRSAVAACAVAIGLVSCRDSTAPTAGERYAMLFSPASPVVGTPVAVSAQLVDAGGAAVRRAGRVVKWSSSIAGTFGGATSTTNAEGIATTSMTLTGVAGVAYQITATDDRGVVGTSAQFISVAGPPARYLMTVPGATATAGSTIAIQAQLADEYSNAVRVAGSAVTWGVSDSSSGSFSTPASTTDATGVATVDFTMGTVAGRAYSFFAKDDHGIFGYSRPVAAIAGPASRLLVYVDSAETDPPAGATVTIHARASDANGNVLADTRQRTVMWSAAGAGAAVTVPTSATDLSGVATTWLATSATAGAGYTVSASDATGLQGTSPTITTQPQVSLASVVTGFGAASVCGTSAAGAMWCWGLNDFGQLGDGAPSSRYLPTRGGGTLALTSVSVGPDFACALTAVGAAYCWGDDSWGQLGDNLRVSRSVAAPVATTVVFQAVAAGGIHACGLATNGDAYCWGDNRYGQLGTTAAGFLSVSPVKVDGGLTFISISAGLYHTCGVVANGTAYCWGQNSSGQLGDGSEVTGQTPQPVAGSLQFTSLSLGESHTCGIVQSGKAYCWGDNLFGQLGTGTGTVPVDTPMPVSGGLTFVSVAAGGVHSCAITAAGSAYCWGDNSQGELGITMQISASDHPVAVDGGLQFKSISAASTAAFSGYDSFYYGPSSFDAHSCGITTDGTAYCWGSNASGQLGVGRSVSRVSSPLKVGGQR
jgi:alpha-tubulin suppressor-like RCC1 family protein